VTSAVSMSVLEKYASINRDIERARNQREGTERDTEAMNEQMRELVQQRSTLQTDTVQANQEVAVFHSRVEAAYAEYTNVEQEHTQAFLAKARAQQEQTCLQQCLAENRQGFLEQSREFRSNCKRMRLRASALGLDHASIRAFAIVNEMDGFIYDELDHPPALTDDEETEDDPGDWVAEDEDEEMQGHLLLYRKEQQAFEIATQRFDKCKTRKETEMNKASSRKDSKDKLQAQVDKIQKDSMDLESMIREKESSTQDMKFMRDNFATSKSQLFAMDGDVVLDLVTDIASMGMNGVRAFVKKSFSRYFHRSEQIQSDAIAFGAHQPGVVAVPSPRKHPQSLCSL
jgi:chromosome segregation ATPase